MTKCPKCGSDMDQWDDTFDFPYKHEVDGSKCMFNQLANVTAERDAAQSEVDKWKRMYREGFDLQMVLAWQHEEDRRDPSAAFTCGGERTIANLIVDEKRRVESAAQSHEHDPGGRKEKQP